MDRCKNLPISPIKNGSLTPIKQLPFSPSLFLNSPNLSFDVTLASTPVKNIPQPLTPRKEDGARVRLTDLFFLSLISIFFNRQTRDYSPLNTPNGLTASEKIDTRPSTSEAVTPHKSDRSPRCDDAPRTPTPFKKALADMEKKSGPLKNLPDTPTRLEDITEIVKKEQDLSLQYETDSSMMIAVRIKIFTL